MSKFKEFIDNIEEKINELTTLEIKTIVGDFKVDSESEITPMQDTQYRLMHTKIDLIDGDITTHLSRSMMNDEFAWARDFHASKEAQAHDLVQSNIQAIISLFGLFNEAKRVRERSKNEHSVPQLESSGDDTFHIEESTTDGEVSF